MYFKESTTVAIFKHFFLDTETCTGVLKKKKKAPNFASFTITFQDTFLTV